MPQQVKFGLLLVCVLTGTFGVLVYKRLHKPADLAAGTDSDPAAVAIADGHPPASTPVVEVADLDQLPLAVVPPPARTVSQPDPVEADDPFATEPVIAKPVAAVGTPSTPPQTTTKLPVDLDEEFFAAPVAAQPVKPFPAAAATPQDMVETDPFAEEPIRAQPVAQSPQTTDADPFDPFGDESAPTAVKSAPVTQSVEAEFDPFADVPEQAEPVSVSSRSAAVPAEPVIELVPEAVPVVAPKPTAPTKTADTFDDPFDLPAAEPKTATTAEPVLVLDEPSVPRIGTPSPNVRAAQPLREVPAVEAFDSFPAAPVATPAPVRAAAPPQALPFDFDDVPVKPSPATGRSPTVSAPGGAYTVAPDDNFWVISRKLYGTGRYFQALAQHNAAVVPDPTKMRPGMKLSAPSVAELEARYPAAISAVPAALLVQPVGGTAADRSRPDKAPGFFVAANGQPMYRVGAEDTLSGIAYTHLGRASRWVQIFELNRGVLKDGNTLKIGVELHLPGDASQVQVMGGTSLRR
jgi:nucleoid-associated protein YgaU